MCRRDGCSAKLLYIPSEYTNQESGYFSIVAGKNGKLYVGTAKYGVNCYLVEYDPVAKECSRWLSMCIA
ncbi:MAG: hypothetical protein U0744_18700 [Gemmataceae bacterium]